MRILWTVVKNEHHQWSQCVQIAILFFLICTRCQWRFPCHCGFWGQWHLLTQRFAEEDVLLIRHTQVCSSEWELGQKYVSLVLWRVEMSLSSKPTTVWMLLDFRCILLSGFTRLQVLTFQFGCFHIRIVALYGVGAGQKLHIYRARRF